MASLSYEGAIFASDPEDDLEGDDPLSKTAGSTLYYHAFAGQQHMKGANEVRSYGIHLHIMHQENCTPQYSLVIMQ
jgi:hypothetical protein